MLQPIPPGQKILCNSRIFFYVGEQLALKQVLHQASAIDDEGLVLSAAVTVYRSGQELLAGSAFAGDKNSCVGRTAVTAASC